MVFRLFIVVFLLAGCATARPWTTEEKVLLGASCLALIADAYTTFDGLENGARELNPTMGKHPSKSKVIVIMGISQVATIILSHYLEGFRLLILGTKTAINTGCALNNMRLN